MVPLTQENPGVHTERVNDFKYFLSCAVCTDAVSTARLRALATHAAILEPLRAASDGRAGFSAVNTSASFLAGAWLEIASQKTQANDSFRIIPEEHAAARSAVMAAMRQGAALLQLRAVAVSQLQRAVRRARRGGFLQVYFPRFKQINIPHVVNC